MIKKQVLEKVASYEHEMIPLVMDLVSIPTENPPGRRYRECTARLEDSLRSIGLDPMVIDVPWTSAESTDTHGEPRSCLLGTHGDGARTLYFHGHYDVVPAVNEEQFQPHVRDGRIYGRGTADMKGGIVAMLFAIRAIKECGVPLDGKIGLCLVPDEETGGTLGSGYLTETGVLGRHGIGMLTAEPTSGVIWNSSRGAISLRIKLKGKQAHVGLYHLGENAFESMLHVANRLMELKEEIERKKTRFNIEPTAARRSIMLLGGQCDAGANFNIVPGECSFTVDRRFNPEEDLEEEKKRILDLLDELGRNGINLESEVFQEGEASATPESEPLAQTLAGRIVELRGTPPPFEICPGLLETRFYNRSGIPALAYGPGKLEVAHGPEEYVAVEDLVDCSAVYALTAIELLSL